MRAEMFGEGQDRDDVLKEDRTVPGREGDPHVPIRIYRPKAEVDGMRLLESLAADGFGASVLPASATTSAGNWKRVPVRGLAPRVVGLVSNRRVPPSATSRAVRAVLFDVVRTHADEQDGIHPAVE